MKPIFLTIIVVFSAVISTFGQWSGNPGTPTRVCTTSSVQVGPWLFADGSGGSYIFWMDARRGNYPNDVQLYAQHLDANGTRLFPDSGKRLVENTSLKTTDYSITQDVSGNFLVSWGLTTITATDSIVYQKFNASTLNPTWPKPRTLAIRGESGFSAPLYLESLQMLPTADSMTVVFSVTWTGGSSVKFINRISASGIRRFGPGKQITGCNTCYGPWTSFMNPDQTVLLIQRNGNGSGTGVTAWKFDKKQNQNWEKSLTGGTAGLSYAFNIVQDGSNGFIMNYETGGDIMATRVDSAGNFVWTPNHKPVCNHSSSQSSPYTVKSGNFMYVVWKDNRPPASLADIYIQKMNLNGDVMWNPTGRRVINLNSYIPVPKLIADGNGDLIVTTFANTVGFVGQKVRPDSSLAWPGYGMLIVTGNNFVPTNGAYSLIQGAEGRVFTAWQTSSNLIYVASLDSAGILTDVVGQVSSSSRSLHLYPNPGSEELVIDGVAPNTDHIHIYNMQGKEVYSETLSPGTLRHAIRPKLSAGMYTVKAGSLYGRWVVQ